MDRLKWEEVQNTRDGGLMSAVLGKCRNCGEPIGYDAMLVCNRCFELARLQAGVGRLRDLVPSGGRK